MSDTHNTQLERIGLQLFSIPALLDEDFAGTMAMLAKLGYKEIEFFGPYEFSVHLKESIGRRLGAVGHAWERLLRPNPKASARCARSQWNDVTIDAN